MARSAIMVVAADAATARRISRALRGADLSVRQAQDFRDAVGHLADPQLAAVFSAITVPGGSGYELARRGTEQRPDLPIFLLWGGFEAYDEQRALEAGVRAGIRRPVSSHAVLAHLEEALGPVPVAASELLGVEPLEEVLPVGSIEPLETPSAASPPLVTIAPPPVADERLASFVPADYDELPPVRIDREEVSVALERAVLAVLPEVLEAILCKSLDHPTRLRAMLQQSITRTVEEQLPTVVERALRDRLGEDGSDH